MALRRVDYTGLDGSTVTMTWGKISVKAVKASYGDGLETAWLPNMGEQSQGEQSPGSYKTDEFKVTVSAMEYRTKIAPRLAKFGFGNVARPIVMGRKTANNGSDSDLLENCRMLKPAASVENSNKVEEMELTFSCSRILWTDQRKAVNLLSAEQQGTHSF